MARDENIFQVIGGVAVILLLLASCDSPTLVELEQKQIPENGIVMNGSEGIKFTGSIVYEFLDGSASIADLASLEVPESMEFKDDVVRAEVNIVKQTDSGVLVLNLYKNGRLHDQVRTETKGKRLTVIYNIKQTHH